MAKEIETSPRINFPQKREISKPPEYEKKYPPFSQKRRDNVIKQKD